MSKVRVSVFLASGHHKLHKFKPPVRCELVVSRLEKLYGVGDLCDEDGDSIVDTAELGAGNYTYTVAQEILDKGCCFYDH